MALTQSEIKSMKQSYADGKILLSRGMWGTKGGRKTCPIMHVSQLRGIGFAPGYDGHPEPSTPLFYRGPIIAKARRDVARYFGLSVLGYLESLDTAEGRKRIIEKLES